MPKWIQHTNPHKPSFKTLGGDLRTKFDDRQTEVLLFIIESKKAKRKEEEQKGKRISPFFLNTTLIADYYFNM